MQIKLKEQRDREKNFWEKYYRVYDVLNMSLSYQRLMDTVIEMADILPGQKILDAGCGSANYAQRIIEKGADYYGIDSLPHAIEIAKAKNIAIPENMLLVDLSMSLPFPENSFDCILCNNVFHLLADKGRANLLNEARRVLKDRGVFIVTVPKKGLNPWKIYLETVRYEMKKVGKLRTYMKVLKMIVPTIKILKYNYDVKRKGNKGDYRFFISNELKQLFEYNGFDETYVRNVYAGQELLIKSKAVK